MGKIQTIKTTLSKTAGRTGLVVRKYSPEILLTVGIVGVIASTVIACRATTKAEEVLDERDKKYEKIRQAKELVDSADRNPEDKPSYTEKDFKKDVTIVYLQTAVGLIKVYAPAITLGVASIGCILGAHGIMKKRNIALMAAYKAIEQGFSDYRKRVVAELGNEKDREFRYGIKKVEEVTSEVDENGKRKKTKVVREVINGNEPSIYARFFDEGSAQWSKTPEYNLMFLKCQQNYANDLLQARGHLFLNEVYDMLGIPRSQAGALVGWVKGVGDDYVDFGIFDSESEAARSFVNGYERNILLDFNVSGVIYDLI